LFLCLLRRIAKPFVHSIKPSTTTDSKFGGKDGIQFRFAQMVAACDAQRVHVYLNSHGCAAVEHATRRRRRSTRPSNAHQTCDRDHWRESHFRQYLRYLSAEAWQRVESSFAGNRPCGWLAGTECQFGTAVSDPEYRSRQLFY